MKHDKHNRPAADPSQVAISWGKLRAALRVLDAHEEAHDRGRVNVTAMHCDDCKRLAASAFDAAEEFVAMRRSMLAAVGGRY